VLGCADNKVFHVRLTGHGHYASINTYLAGVAGYDADGAVFDAVFLIEAYELLVVVGRQESDEVSYDWRPLPHITVVSRGIVDTNTPKI